VRAHWLDMAIPAVIFLLSAAIYREIHGGWQGRQYAAWEKQFQAAATAQNRGQRELALRELFAAAASAPAVADAHAQLARAFNGVRLPERAGEQMELALREGRPDQAAALALVGRYCDLGRFADADRVLHKEVLARWPESADTLYWRGVIALEGSSDPRSSEELSLAARYFQESLRLKPDNLGVRFRYGVCLAGLDRFPDAERELRKVIQVSPTYVGAYKQLADVLRKQGKTGEARQALAQLQHLDDIDQNIQFIESRRRLGQAPPEDLAELGSLYTETGHLTNAEAALAEYALLEPTDPSGYRKLAVVHKKMNLLQNAASDLKLAAALEHRGAAW
jgi:tetratricopeptide (TPR) repeat protein